MRKAVSDGLFIFMAVGVALGVYGYFVPGNFSLVALANLGAETRAAFNVHWHDPYPLNASTIRPSSSPTGVSYPLGFRTAY